MKHLGMVVIGMFMSLTIFAQSESHLKSLQGIYTYGNYYPIYLKNNDGTTDSSMSYCSYGQLELYYFEGKLRVNIDVCGGTYHVGNVSGVLEFRDDENAELKYNLDDEDMGCHLKFKFGSKVVTVEEINCTAYHGARAGFGGTYDYVRNNSWQDANEVDEIKKQVNAFFADFNAGNFDNLDKYCLNPADFILITILQNDAHGPIHIDHLKELKKTLSSIKGRYEERLGEISVLVHDHMAVAWMRYDFIKDGSIYHCGVNKFDFIKYKGQWKISALEEDYYSTACSENAVMDDLKTTESEQLLTARISGLMDTWHKAAADANAEVFFGFMSDECIYLGTDPKERWDKESFVAFAKPYFDKGKAWSFETNWRNVYFDSDYQLAWFEESLDTHMGECRGTGVLVKTKGGWKLKHYNLSVTVDNDKMGDFKKLTGQ